MVYQVLKGVNQNITREKVVVISVYSAIESVSIVFGAWIV